MKKLLSLVLLFFCLLLWPAVPETTVTKRKKRFRMKMREGGSAINPQSENNLQCYRRPLHRMDFQEKANDLIESIYVDE